ncbi:apolipoprotein N-acyltransferase [[Pseudomonas] carboxydohydrogena]|uniref:Apolipoprotein N-acyltransferase n=1 Tax=Afipia carboxydohydrogena TaxID=290 RepID=A0ABY8BSF7_AFICR|nr:apolipoprotein N-acyltransferase [[Pseudomonas] carboxydohydrogena]WEF51585.1 apolipoprotein N-acyltransferase [[Pseudomonas] carboxydohydrogena]
MSVATALHSPARAIILSWGWRRAAIALAAGAISALAMAPFNAWPVLFITFPVLVWLIDGTGTGRRGVTSAAIAGWWFGLGYFVAGLYWIGNALLVDADTFAWLLPLAILGLPALLALFMAAGCALARLIWTRDWSRLLSLAVALTVSEWLRGHILSGFPWNLFGYALAEPLAMAQAASLIGIWGVSFLAIAIFASPATLIDDRARTTWPWLPFAVSILLLAASGGYGAWRLDQHPTQFVGGVKLRLMQPNLQQDVKFNYSAKDDVIAKYMALSDRATGPQTSGVRDATILIWPESAFPFFLTREPAELAKIAGFLPPQTTLITGAVRAPDLSPAVKPTRAYNSIYVINHDGDILSVYDKLHLVPFGEYLPFQNMLEKIGFQQITKVQGGFIPGSRRRTMAIPGTPRVLPLICYEVAFSNAIVPAGERPGWIVNLTNDGWFGNSTGPYQHLQMARLRAIEEGLPIVRSANTGISAVIDPVGREVGHLALGQEAVLDSALPVALPPTVFSRWRHIPLGVMVLFAGLVVLVRRRRED